MKMMLSKNIIEIIGSLFSPDIKHITKSFGEERNFKGDHCDIKKMK